MNWLVAYGTGALASRPHGRPFTCPGFYGGMTVGRLVFSPRYPLWER